MEAYFEPLQKLEETQRKAFPLQVPLNPTSRRQKPPDAQQSSPIPWLRIGNTQNKLNLVDELDRRWILVPKRTYISSVGKKLKLTVHKAEGEAHRFVNAVGKKKTAIGYTHVPCAFQDNSQQQVNSRFWVFPILIVSLLVGRKFLESTETLTRFRHRLQKLILRAGIALRVLHLEAPKWRMNCTVDGRATLANPDTGSDLDLISLSYVRENGFRMEKLPSGREYIQFADGTEHWLKGVVSVPFAIGRGEDVGVSRKFNVLDGLTSEVLLGNQT